MSETIENVNRELRRSADDARATFGRLSLEQLNWKASDKSWSIAQCFDHLITAHSLYFPLFEKLAKGDLTQSVWERYSPFSGFFGGFLVRSLDPKYPKKMKTTSKGRPSMSEIDAEIISRFYEHQLRMIDHLQRIPEAIDPRTFKITSPLLGFATYALGDAFTFLPAHCRRHFEQAKRVMDHGGFPESAEANYGK
jgi:DinB family protein